MKLKNIGHFTKDALIAQRVSFINYLFKLSSQQDNPVSEPRYLSIGL